MNLQTRSLSHRRRISLATWTPASPTSRGYSPAHWYRSDQGLWQDAGTTPATTDGDSVGRWDDLTTNADHVNQATAANKPTLQNGAADLLNGHPVVRFDGSDHFLTGPFTTGGNLTQPYTALYVAKLATGLATDGTYHLLLDGNDVTNTGRFGKNASDKWYIQNGATSLSGGDADESWNIWTTLANGLTSQLWKNGMSQNSGDAGTDHIDGLTIGGRYDGAASNWADDVVEVIYYHANLDTDDKNQVGRYLADRYGISYTDI